jgi:hypothetical protein
VTFNFVLGSWFMKKLLGIVVLGLLFNNNLLAEEYSNSWKMDILCKQGKNEWYESALD